MEKDLKQDDEQMRLGQQLNKIQEKYKQLCDLHSSEIKDELRKVNDHLKRAAKLADKYGIPFEHDDSKYVPSQIKEEYEALLEMFPETDLDIHYEFTEAIDSVTNVCVNDPDYGDICEGWWAPSNC